MTRAFFLSLTLIVAASVASAQSVRVRSGEHDGYTRIVVQVPPGTGWVLTPQPRGARLSLDLEGVEFETRSAFDRLSQGRLATLTQPEPGATLELGFGCECVATAFLHQQTMVVVDIAPGEYIPPPEPIALPPLLPDPKNTRRSTTSEQIQDVDLSVPLLQLKRRGFETQLMSRILQGADRDVVDLNLAGVGARQSGYFGPIQLPLGLPGNLNVSSILDELQGLERSPLQQVDTRPACIAYAELGFDAWSGSQPFPQQIAALRTGLFQEFDRLDTEKAEKLAQLYTYYGFGAEAVQVLKLAPQTITKWDRIDAIARLMDGQTPAAPNPFHDQQRCGGDAALWALLTERRLAEDAQSNEIEQAFARLPRHLKRQFGPALSDIFVEAGNLEASRRVLRSVERVDGGDQPEVALAKASVAVAEGDGTRAEDLLTKAAAAPDAAEEAPIALARLIEKRWSDRGAVTGRELDLAAGFAVEFRRSEIGPMMARTHAIALGLNQEFDAALELVRAAPDKEDWRRSHDQILQLLAERADDVTFLRHALALSEERPETLKLDTAVSLSERLTHLGFAGPGFALANRRTDSARKTDRSHLRARAALRQEKPRQALLELSGDDSETAQNLRAQALVESLDFAGAALVLQRIGKNSEADRNFWRAGLLEKAGGEGSGNYKNLARLSQLLGSPIRRQPDKLLSDAAGLLQGSAEMRAQIDEMFRILEQDTPN